jgi:hypothetical protein
VMEYLGLFNQYTIGLAVLRMNRVIDIDFQYFGK